MHKQVDYLIVGQGLAGSLLSWELIKQGCTVHLIDNQQENASQIAAGLINPVTGMRLVKSNHIDSLLPCALKTYQELSHYFKQSFYIEKPILRILRNEKEWLKFQQRLNDPAYSNFLAPQLKQTPHSIHAPLGVIQQKQTGYLLTKKLLAHLQNFLLTKNNYQAAQFNYSDLQLGKSVIWHELSAKKIIFCEGYQAINNPWFKTLPFQLAKGEILTLTSKMPLIPNILNYGHWFIPLNKYQFRTGASFDSQHINTHITESARQNLLTSLRQIYPVSKIAHLEQHQANIRPTTLDKAPFIGIHPQHKQLAIFNGFGAKGSLQIPYYSQQFTQYLLHNTAIDPHANCQRYKAFACA